MYAIMIMSVAMYLASLATLANTISRSFPRRHYQVIIVPRGTTYSIDGAECSREELIKHGVVIKYHDEVEK